VLETSYTRREWDGWLYIVVAWLLVYVLLRDRDGKTLVFELGRGG